AYLKSAWRHAQQRQWVVHVVLIEAFGLNRRPRHSLRTHHTEKTQPCTEKERDERNRPLPSQSQRCSIEIRDTREGNDEDVFLSVLKPGGADPLNRATPALQNDRSSCPLTECYYRRRQGMVWCLSMVINEAPGDRASPCRAMARGRGLNF
ncbi:hypothetical protein DNTS_004917, partial [Danionella cerebrum]